MIKLKGSSTSTVVVRGVLMGSSRVADVVERLASSLGAGPSPKFDEYHVIKILTTLLREGVVGRVRLSKMLSLGEGTTRTLLSRMKSMGLVEESKRGCSLTSLGREVAEVLASKILSVAEVSVKELGLEGKGVGVLVRGAATKADAVGLRDEAVRRGARGLITIALRGGKLVMPMVEEDVEAKWPRIARSIIDAFKPSNGDVVLIGVADDTSKAERGALMAAWSLAFKSN
jgi:predicted transcriptional regulator